MILSREYLNLREMNQHWIGQNCRIKIARHRLNVVGTIFIGHAARKKENELSGTFL
jgi:hypothetical protein